MPPSSILSSPKKKLSIGLLCKQLRTTHIYDHYKTTTYSSTLYGLALYMLLSELSYISLWESLSITLLSSFGRETCWYHHLTAVLNATVFQGGVVIACCHSYKACLGCSTKTSWEKKVSQFTCKYPERTEYDLLKLRSTKGTNHRFVWQ